MASILDLTQERHAHIDHRLHNDEVIWLHTTRPDGRPHAVVVWFLWDGETVLIYSIIKTCCLHWTTPTMVLTPSLLKEQLHCLHGVMLTR